MLSAEDRRHPLSPALIISNFVLEREAEAARAQLPRCGPGDAVLLEARLQLLQLRVDGLVAAVESGELTAEAYLAMLRTAVDKDRTLDAWLQREGRADEAAAVRRRVEWMREEIADAAASGVGGGGTEEGHSAG